MNAPDIPPISSALEEAIGCVYRRLEAEIASTGAACWNHSRCCDFERCDHRLYATSLEIAHVRAAHPTPLVARGRLCPFWEDGRCHERERRPLGCRTYFCDPRFRVALEAIHERYLRELRRVAEAHGFPWYYGEFVPAIVRRGP